MNRDKDLFEFDAESESPHTRDKSRWVVLSVEDNALFQQTLVHTLKNMLIHGHSLEVLTASNSAEARLMLEQRADINLVFLDVVMETDDAGLQLVNVIRHTLNNPIIRIILLTGQPGQAPSRQVMERYDIDDYWTKTELREDNLFNTLNGNLKTWRRMEELRTAREGMENVVAASQAISRRHDALQFSQTVLDEIDRIIGISDGGIMSLELDDLVSNPTRSEIIVATGQFKYLIGQPIDVLNNDLMLRQIQRAIKYRKHQFHGYCSVLFFAHEQPESINYVIVVRSIVPLTEADIHLLKVFGENIFNGFANLALTENLNELAYKHRQTKIHNRNWLYKELSDSTYWDRASQIVLITLSNLSDITVTFGEEFTIELLKVVDKELTALPGVQALALISRDAFAILLDDDNEFTAETFNVFLKNKVDINGRDYNIIAKAVSSRLVSSLNRSPEQLLSQLESHLSRFKLSHSTSFHSVELDKGDLISEQLQLLNAFNRGLNNKEIKAFLQPKVDMQSGKLIGFEALARWFTPMGEMIPPDVFIPIAETSGLIEELDKTILLDCCHALKKLQSVGVTVPISFNVSSHELLLGGFANSILSLIQAEGVAPHQLDIEITETSAMVDYEQVSVVLKQFIDIGMDVSIDDFGTGFSSLSHITELAATTLKIDKSFIEYLGEKDASVHVVEMIIRIASRFGLKVIAEGVETELHRDKLLELGCFNAQGYFYARPMPIEEAIQWALRHQ